VLEEQMLIQLVGKWGLLAWKRIVAKIGRRSDIQCRYHWLQIQRGFECNPAENNEPRITPRRSLCAEKSKRRKHIHLPFRIESSQMFSSCSLVAIKTAHFSGNNNEKMGNTNWNKMSHLMHNFKGRAGKQRMDFLATMIERSCVMKSEVYTVGSVLGNCPINGELNDETNRGRVSHKVSEGL
jgi:hypothetical protein